MKRINSRGDAWKVAYLLAMRSTMKPGKFWKLQWTPRDAIVSNDGWRYTIYKGQTFDLDKLTLRKDIWSHNHCEASNCEPNDFQGEGHAVGYFNGFNWLCEGCGRLSDLDDCLNLKLGLQDPNHSVHKTTWPPCVAENHPTQAVLLAAAGHTRWKRATCMPF